MDYTLEILKPLTRTPISNQRPSVTFVIRLVKKKEPKLSVCTNTELKSLWIISQKTDTLFKFLKKYTACTIYATGNISITQQFRCVRSLLFTFQEKSHKLVKNVRFTSRSIFTLQIFAEYFCVREVLRQVSSRRTRTHLILKWTTISGTADWLSRFNRNLSNIYRENHCWNPEVLERMQRDGQRGTKTC